MATAVPPIGQVGGSVLADAEIREAIANGDIRIVALPTDQIGRSSSDPRLGNLQYYERAVHPTDPTKDEPRGCFESTGYKLLPLRYYDRKSNKWVLIPDGNGYRLKPGREVVIEPRQFVGFSERYCAVHLARFSGQLSGASIATGLIQPNWGAAREAPVYISVRNIGRTPVNITRKEALSRLVFFRVSGTPINKLGTSHESIKEFIEGDQETIKKRNARARLKRRAYYGAGIVLLVSSYWWLPALLPRFWSGPDISQYMGQVIVALFAVLVTQFLHGERNQDV